jgi:hypothetical protein
VCGAVQLRMSKCELQNERLRSVSRASLQHPTRGTAIKASFNTCTLILKAGSHRGGSDGERQSTSQAGGNVTPVRLRPLRDTSVQLPEAILHLTIDIRK